VALRPRPEIQGLRIAEHGGLDYAELETLGISADEVVDFSVSSNPHGPPPGVRAAINGRGIETYPDSLSAGLCRALAGCLGVAPENILAASGSTELIRLTALAYLDSGSSAAMLAPTFGEYEVACRIAGADIIRVPLLEEETFRLDVDRAVDLIAAERPRVVFLCNPNNPTGGYLGRGEVDRLLAAAPDSLFVLDEAYVAFVDEAWPWQDMVLERNMVVLRSMTKDYTLAGLRLGYGVGRKDVIDALRRVCPPWNVSSVAQRAGIVAVRQEGFVEASRARIAMAKAYLTRSLSRLGFRCVPSSANYFLVEVGDARYFRRQLLRKRFLVRDCTSFGLPSYVRIAPRTLGACRRLIAAIEEIQQEDRVDS